MKKFIYFCLLIISFSSLANSPSDTLKKITKNIYGVFGVPQQVSKENRGFISNAYFYISDKYIVVFDALSSYQLGKELISTIKKVSNKPIKYLIITHYHTDHFYGIQAFKEIGITTIAHKWAYEYLSDPYAIQFFESRKKVLGNYLKGTKIIPPDVAIENYAIINLDTETIEAKQVCKGHTNGDIIIYIPKENALVVGDLIFDERVPFLGSGNSKSWIKCIDEIIKLKPEVVLPGHGNVLVGQENILNKANFTKQYILDLRSIIKNWIDEYGYDVDYVKNNIVKAMIEKNPEYKKVKLFESVTKTNAYYIYFEVEKELFMEP